MAAPTVPDRGLRLLLGSGDLAGPGRGMAVIDVGMVLELARLLRAKADEFATTRA